MAKYTCETCQKVFSQKGHLEDHNKRKRPCKKDNTIEALVEKKVQEILLKTNGGTVKIETTPTEEINLNTMDYSKKTREELIAICKERKIKGYSGKKKDAILQLLAEPETIVENTINISPINTDAVEEKISRLNYIGSKFKLLEWIINIIKEKTKWDSFDNKTIADLFAGTGIVSYTFRKQRGRVISNDAELYSSIITHAFTRSVFTEHCKNILTQLQKEIEEKKHLTTDGFITNHYSPYGPNERKFFTIENARQIDYLRGRLESIKKTMTIDEYKFILASILISADAVSNVPAVYGCYLKNFKAKAMKNMTLTPIHTLTTEAIAGSQTFNSDVLDREFLQSFESDIVYLDPPYNERQYSKNYFPLNIIAKTPDELLTEEPLKGKTGIPTDCFISPFCKKGETVEKAFDLLFQQLKTKWIFLSYNSESIVSKDKMLDIMKKYGNTSVMERDYKRFKSFEYNKDVNIKEYLFCLQKN
jgi:adenine-specific DNA-methyltransferase